MVAYDLWHAPYPPVSTLAWTELHRNTDHRLNPLRRRGLANLQRLAGVMLASLRTPCGSADAPVGGRGRLSIRMRAAVRADNDDAAKPGRLRPVRGAGSIGICLFQIKQLHQLHQLEVPRDGDARS
jgi:hypothetical protein